MKQKHLPRKDLHFGKPVAFLCLTVQTAPEASCALTPVSSRGPVCLWACSVTRSLQHLRSIICLLPTQAASGLLPSTSLASSRWLSFSKQMLKQLELPPQKCIKQLSFLYLSVFWSSYFWCGFTGRLYSTICNTPFKGQQPSHADRPEGPCLLHKPSLKTNKSWAAWIIYSRLSFTFPYWLEVLCGKAFSLLLSLSSAQLSPLQRNFAPATLMCSQNYLLGPWKALPGSTSLSFPRGAGHQWTSDYH